MVVSIELIGSLCDNDFMAKPKNYCREQVLQKALPLFWERGYADTGLQDLEKATNVNKSGLYAEFKSKQDLYLACLDYYFEHLSGQSTLMTEPLGWNNLEKFIRAPLSTCTGESKGCFSVNSMRDIAILPVEAQELIANNRAKLKRYLIKNLAEENTKMPPEAIADLILTFFSGLLIEQNLKTSKAAFTRKIEEFITVLHSL
jgi:AcrR family transcriptional regulator